MLPGLFRAGASRGRRVTVEVEPIRLPQADGDAVEAEPTVSVIDFPGGEFVGVADRGNSISAIGSDSELFEEITVQQEVESLTDLEAKAAVVQVQQPPGTPPERPRRRWGTGSSAETLEMEGSREVTAAAEPEAEEPAPPPPKKRRKFDLMYCVILERAPRPKPV
jgi:hypothetical protein